MDNLRFFAILDENNVVVNVMVFPKEEQKIIKYNLDSKCIWVYTGDIWDNRDYQYYLEDFHSKIGVVDFVEKIEGDPQLFLKEKFPDSLINDVVIVESKIPIEEETILGPDSLLETYPTGYKVQEYSYDGSITSEPASIKSTYDIEKNTFISSDED
jgi:hypothetical protein